VLGDYRIPAMHDGGSGQRKSTNPIAVINPGRRSNRDVIYSRFSEPKTEVEIVGLIRLSRAPKN
jgi:hypothetical protein